jgi:hypothetical protein
VTSALATLYGFTSAWAREVGAVRVVFSATGVGVNAGDFDDVRTTV